MTNTSKDFLLSETGEDVNSTMLDAIVLGIYGSTHKEDYNDFVNQLNEYENSHPVSMEYLIKALDKCVLNIPNGFGIENVFNFISLYYFFDDAKVIGNFLKYIFNKYQTIDEIRNANVDDIGLYYKSKFELLQAFCNEEVSVK